MSQQPLYNIPKGSILKMDGRELKVSACVESGYFVECQDTGEVFDLSVKQVEDAIRARECDVIQPADAAKRKALLKYTGGIECLEQIRNEEIRAIAQARLALVLAQDALLSEGLKLTQRSMSSSGKHRKALLARADEISPGFDFQKQQRGGRKAKGFAVPQGRTLAEDRKTFHDFDQNPVVLAPRDHLKGNRAARLTPWQERFIAYTLNTWSSKLKPKLSKVYEGAKAVFHRTSLEIAEAVEFPCITTIRARKDAISQVAQDLGRGGQEHATNVHGAGSTDVRALAYGEKFEWDQYLISMFTSGDGVLRAKVIDPNKGVEELEDNEVRRCWLHVIIDVATREILGWIMSETADSDHSMALLRMATRDKTKEKVRFGCKQDPAPPVGLGLGVADNGSATRNAAVYAAQLGMGGTVMTARARQPLDKMVIERMFGTLQWDVLNFSHGYTGSRPGELTGYEPKEMAKLSHDALYGMLTRYFIDEYPFRSHRGTGMYGATPNAKREEALRRYGGINPPTQRDRCLHLGHKVELSTTSEGVRPFKIPFNSTQLQTFAGGASKKVTVHLDPDDLRKVYVTAPGLPEPLEVPLTMTVFKDLTLEEAIEMMEDATKANPKRTALHEEQLEEARARRVRESGFFPDSRDPSNYQTMFHLEYRAQKLLQVEKRPTGYHGATAPPGKLMSRSNIHGVSQAKAAAPSTAPLPTDPEPSPKKVPKPSKTTKPAPSRGKATPEPSKPEGKSMTFKPIKDSKI